MPSLRIAAEDQVAMAVDDLVGLGSRTADLAVRASGAAVAFRVGGDEWSATVVPVDSAGLADAQRLTATAKDAKVVVGNKLSEDARAHLSDAGWSWFDRRVGAHLAHGTRVLDVRFVAEDAPHDEAGPVPLASPRSDGPIRGRAGTSYAAALLLDPEHPPSLRAVAREIGMSPTAISNAATAALHHRAGRRRRHARAPRPVLGAGRRLAAGQGRRRRARCPTPPSARRPTRRAGRWAGTVPRSSSGRRCSPPTSDRGSGCRPRPRCDAPQRALGAAAWADRRAAIAVPPTPLVVTRRVASPKPGEPWPLAHPRLRRARPRS